MKVQKYARRIWTYNFSHCFYEAVDELLVGKQEMKGTKLPVLLDLYQFIKMRFERLKHIYGKC